MFNTVEYQSGRRDEQIKDNIRHITRLEIVQSISAITAFLAIGLLSLATQRLGDGAKSSAATAIALAQALKEEKDTARDTLAAENTQSNSKWTKTNTLIAALGVIGSFAIGAGTFYLATR